MDAFPPIEQLAFLADGETAALIGPDGAVEWLCLPRIDEPSVFGTLLDRGAGRWTLAPTDPAATMTRRYHPGSLVLETTWTTATGRVAVIDALISSAAGPGRALVRWTFGVAGEVELESRVDVAADYGRQRPRWRPGDGEAWAADLPDGTGLTLVGHAGPDAPPAPSRFRVTEADARALVLGWGDAASLPRSASAALAAIDTTDRTWSDWLATGRFPDGPWRPLLERSALVLRGLTFAATGLPVAAATTSLPETPGGERNWDYRYTWLRDGTYTLAALQDLGFHQEARRFIRFLAAEHARGVPLQLMFRVGGELELPESTLDHLGGYRGARPVRIGNGAAHQAQHDMWGALLDLVWRDVDRGGTLDDATWALCVPQVEAARAAWRLPDRGIWEVRGEPRHFTSSKLYGWVALDRGARLARVRGATALAADWEHEAAAIRADLEAHGTDARGVFTQSYGVSALDASVLLMPLLGFLPPSDPRIRATVLAIADELTENGLVLRYRTETADDGLAGEEGSFMICSFWLVQALVRIGERERARVMFERLAGFASELGLLAEEVDLHSGGHLGNTPQAFSHLALIGAALDLARP
ncbi:MAG: glycoside hydrolase family 15 protein [Chloroflexota bacterium]